MVGELTNDSSVLDALDGSDSCKLVSCDGQESGLDFMQLRGAIESGVGLAVSAAMPTGTHGMFNAMTASIDLTGPPPSVQQPAVAPDVAFKNPVLGS